MVRNRVFYLNKSSFPFTIKPSKGRVHLFVYSSLIFLFLIYGLYRNIKVFWEGMNRMSKKKKNIRRKKSNNLLKGMAAAGAVVGGGTIFAGNNAVYAAENEQGVIGSQSEEQIIESQSVSESTTESLSQVKSETSSYENEGAVETSAVEGNTVQTNHKAFVKRAPRFFNDEQNIMTVDETENEKAVSENDAEIESASLSVSGSISGSISEVGSQISSESISGREAESEMVSESHSSSTSTEDFRSESESLSEQFNSTSLKFDSELNETLEDLIIQINASKAKLEAIRQEAINSDKTLGTDYRDEADNLAVLLAKYSFFQKYGVGKIDNSSYQYNNHAPGSNAKRNNFFVKYENKDKSESHVGYFDWVGVTEKKMLTVMLNMNLLNIIKQIQTMWFKLRLLRKHQSIAIQLLNFISMKIKMEISLGI